MPKELKKITQAIVKNYRPDKIILFGSRVWGKPKPWSDYDLFILKKYAKKRVLDRMIEVSYLIDPKKYPNPVDTIVYNQKELDLELASGSQMYRDIISKGKILYERG